MSRPKRYEAIICLLEGLQMRPLGGLLNDK